MGDRTYYRLALPADLDREVVRMAAIAFTDDPWTDDDVTRLLDHARPDQTLWVDIEERYVGECRDAAEAVLTALTEEGQDVAFTGGTGPEVQRPAGPFPAGGWAPRRTPTVPAGMGVLGGGCRWWVWGVVVGGGR